MRRYVQCYTFGKKGHAKDVQMNKVGMSFMMGAQQN